VGSAASGHSGQPRLSARVVGGEEGKSQRGTADASTPKSPPLPTNNDDGADELGGQARRRTGRSYGVPGSVRMRPTTMIPIVWIVRRRRGGGGRGGRRLDFSGSATLWTLCGSPTYERDRGGGAQRARAPRRRSATRSASRRILADRVWQPPHRISPEKSRSATSGAEAASAPSGRSGRGRPPQPLPDVSNLRLVGVLGPNPPVRQVAMHGTAPRLSSRFFKAKRTRNAAFRRPALLLL
jgi:hypothetical protein